MPGGAGASTVIERHSNRVNSVPKLYRIEFDQIRHDVNSCVPNRRIGSVEYFPGDSKITTSNINNRFHTIVGDVVNHELDIGFGNSNQAPRTRRETLASVLVAPPAGRINFAKYCSVVGDRSFAEAPPVDGLSSRFRQSEVSLTQNAPCVHDFTSLRDWCPQRARSADSRSQSCSQVETDSMIGLDSVHTDAACAPADGCFCTAHRRNRYSRSDGWYRLVAVRPGGIGGRRLRILELTGVSVGGSAEHMLTLGSRLAPDRFDVRSPCGVGGRWTGGSSTPGFRYISSTRVGPPEPAVK